jgi:hypothetical protein
MAEIKTDVDRLVALVKEKKAVSVDDTSKILHLNSNTIESLAESLEDCGILSIEYRFTQQFLVDRMSEQEKNESIKLKCAKANARDIPKDEPVGKRIKALLCAIENDEKAISAAKKEIDRILRQKNEIIPLITRLLKEESEIKSSMSALMRKASMTKIFHSANAGREKEISEQFEKLSRKKESIDAEIKSLGKMVRL